MKIKSYWRKETAGWTEETGYVDREWSPVEEKEIEVIIEYNIEDRPIIRFIGGPTGHESYYVDTLRQN